MRTIAGHPWLLAPVGLDCGAAQHVVATLAGRKVPPTGKFPGTYSGMTCSSTTRPGTKPKHIGCDTRDHKRTIFAAQVS